jgi:hypothetical protein
LDTCALILVGIDGVSLKPTRFLFATARHAAVDLTQSFALKPVGALRRYQRADFSRLCRDFSEHGVILRDDDETWKHLKDLRAMYEPFVEALAAYLLVPPPELYLVADRVDDWQTSAWDHFLPSSPRVLDRTVRSS